MSVLTQERDSGDGMERSETDWIGVQSPESPNSRVKVLLTDTNRWGLSARLAVALREVGCSVSAICPFPNHPLSRTRAVDRLFRYSSLHPRTSILNAIEQACPDIVVPTCDRSAAHLHELGVFAAQQSGAARSVANLIERSMGSAASRAIVSSRYQLLSMAGQAGLRVPDTQPLRSNADLQDWSAQERFPWVIKADGTGGGRGVRVVHTVQEMDGAFAQLRQAPRISKALKRAVVNRDSFWLRPWWKGERPAIIAQAYVAGRPANCAVLSWEGEVRAIICVEVLQSDGLTGPASVVRVIRNAEMTHAAETIAARLKLSGFFGLDFVLEEGSNAAFLVEMNPRATPPCYLYPDLERNLPAALWSALTHTPPPPLSPIVSKPKIAYFPPRGMARQALPADCQIDEPSGEPELVSELLHPFPDRTLLFKLTHFLTRDRNVGEGD
jgi:hypothetical protein